MLFAAYCLLGWNVKLPLVCFICFLLSSPSPSLSLSFSDLSLVAGLFLLSPAMMAPHLAVGTMRNDKMGEPCFYLMGQNQTTVCSQKSAMIHPPPLTTRPPDPLPSGHLSLLILSSPLRPLHPYLHPSLFVRDKMNKLSVLSCLKSNFPHHFIYTCGKDQN